MRGIDWSGPLTRAWPGATVHDLLRTYMNHLVRRHSLAMEARLRAELEAVHGTVRPSTVGAPTDPSARSD